MYVYVVVTLETGCLSWFIEAGTQPEGRLTSKNLQNARARLLTLGCTEAPSLQPAFWSVPGMASESSVSHGLKLKAPALQKSLSYSIMP